MQSNNRIFNLLVLAFSALTLWLAGRPQAPAAAVSTAPAAVTDRQAAAAAGCDSSRTVQVSGAAVVNITPDRALIQLGVQSNGATPDGVRSENAQAVQSVIRAVRGLGVDAKDIATDYFLVYPVYVDYDALTIRGYRIDNTVSITLRDIRLAEQVLVAAIKAGANEVQGIEFYTSELRKFRDQARQMAVQAASEKAQALAGAAGAEAGCVLSISENTWSQYYGSWRGGRATALWAQNVIQNASSSQPAGELSDDSPISLGQIAVRAEVNASFTLK